MAQTSIGVTRTAQATAGSAINANFSELYAFNKLVTADASAAAGTFVVPAGYIIEHVVYNNNTANVVTGGIKFGTTVGAADIVSAQAVAANGKGVVTGAAVLLRFFSKTVDQTVYFDAVTAWNSASVDIRVFLKKIF